MKNSIFFVLLIISCSFSTKAQEYYPDSAGFLGFIPIQPLPFIDSIGDPSSYVLLSESEKQVLSLGTAIPGRDLMLVPVQAAYQLKLNENYITLVIAYIWNNTPHHTLINYAKHLRPIACLDLAYSNKDGKFQSSEASITQLDVEIRQHYAPASTRYNRFLFGNDGSIVPKVYQPWTQLKDNGKLADVRAVKAKNGITVWNKKGNPVDTIAYGSDIYIIKYVGELKHNQGRKALIALDFFRYLDDLLVPSDSSNYAYVYDAYLYKGSGFFAGYNEKGDQAKPTTRFYYTHAITIKTPWERVTDLDIRELLTIERIDIEAFRDKIIRTETAPNPFNFPYNKKPFKLQLKNGELLHFKDSIYEDLEYSPTNHFQLVIHTGFKDDYLIYNSFFEDSRFLLLNKQNGDTSAIFQGYPFVSPNGHYIISLKTPYTYGSGEAQLEVQTRQGKTYHFELNALFAYWNLPNQLEVYWLDEKSFILKVKDVENAYSDESEASFFYLKFTISDSI